MGENLFLEFYRREVDWDRSLLFLRSCSRLGGDRRSFGKFRSTDLINELIICGFRVEGEHRLGLSESGLTERSLSELVICG